MRTRAELKELRLQLFGVSAECSEVRMSLANDVYACKEMIIHHDNDCWRRSYIRAVFAYIEGSVFLFKQILLTDTELLEIKLTTAEFVYLKEESFQLSENGEIATKPNYGIRLSQNIRFLFNIYNSVYGIDCKVDASESSWNSFKEAMKARNNITHPKGLRDIVVSDEALKYAENTFLWFEQKTEHLPEDAFHASFRISKKSEDNSQNPDK